MLEITTKNFETEVLHSKQPVIIDFWAEWCMPCKMLGPIFEKVSADLQEIKFGKLNVDANQEVAAKFGISSIPCLVMFQNGAEIGRIVGALPEEELKNKIKSIVKI